MILTVTTIGDETQLNFLLTIFYIMLLSNLARLAAYNSSCSYLYYRGTLGGNNQESE
jgi:hypothetical protein